MNRVAGVTAVVVAARGGARLARALGSVAWADERVVLDPAARLPAARLAPPSWPAAGLRLEGAGGGTDLAAVVSTPWLLLLHERESAAPGLAAAVAAVAQAPGARGSYRVPQEVEGFGVRFRPPGAPVRLARRDGARLRVTVHGGLAIAAPEPRPGRLAAGVIAHAAPSVTDTVDEMEADGSVVAALLALAAVRPGIGRSLLAATTAGARIACARRVASGPERWREARWCLTTLTGYGALLAHAQLWERSECEGSPAP